MAKDRRKLQHIHSSIKDRQPTPATLEVGEIAVNNNADNEFLSLKNSNDRVVRFSSDEQLITIMEKKEVMPYVGYVRGGAGPSATAEGSTADTYGSYGIENSDLINNTSEIIIKLNQVAADNTTKHDKVNGAKDKYSKDVNPTTDGGLNDGAGFFIDMSRYAMQDANPRFSGITNTCYTTLNGTTKIHGLTGDCGSLLDIKVDSAKTDIETATTEITSVKTTIGTNDITISGDTTLKVSGTTTETKKGDVTETNLADKQESTSGNSYNDVKLNYSGTTGGTTTEVKVGNVTENHSGTTTENKKGDVTESNLANKVENTTGNYTVNTTGITSMNSTGNTCITSQADADFYGKDNTKVGVACDGSVTTKVTAQGKDVVIDATTNNVGITAKNDVDVSTENDINITANNDICETAGVNASFYAVTRTNLGIDCDNSSSSTTTNLYGDTVNEVANTMNVTATTLNEEIGTETKHTSGTTTITRDGNVIENNKNNVTINTTGTTNFNYTGATSLSGSSLTSRTTGNTEFKVSGNTRIDTIGTTDIISTGSTTIESKGTGSDMCISAADVAGFVGANKTNIGKNCADGGQTTTLNINGDTINETGNTVNISGSSDVNVSGGTSVNVSGGTNVNVQGGTQVCISAGTKANLYAPETNVGVSCEGSTATTVNVSGTTINEGGTNINETFTNGTLNITNYDLNGDKICISGATNANVYGTTTNIGTDCDGSTTATTVNISGTTINEGGTTNNNDFTTINTTANTENHTTTSFTVTTGDLCLTSTGDADFGGDTNTRIGTNCDGTGISNNTTIYASTAVTINAPTTNVTGNTNISGDTIVGGNLIVSGESIISGDTVISGNTTISGDTVISGTATVSDTLIVKEGLEKTLSWSYGNVQSATSDSTNFKEDKSFVIPQDANEINRRKVSWSYGSVTNASGGNYEPGQSADGSFVIPKALKDLNNDLSSLKFTTGTTNVSESPYNGSAEKTITIPSCASHINRRTLSWSNGAANTGSYDPGASCDNTDSGTNIVIPSGLSHLTDWSNNCLNIANNLCVNGTVTATGGMYTSSDRDLKENITYIGGHDISKATRIKLKAFNYKNDPSNRKVYGVIAQDLEEIGLNELVHYDESGMRSVDYTGLLLLKLAALEKEIDILKHKLEEKNN